MSIQDGFAGDLSVHYTNLYHDAVNKIKTDTYETDRLMDVPDRRFGLTLITHPAFSVRNNIQQFLDELKVAEPDQYYYRDSDIHVTILSIISCYVGFDLSQVSVNDYIELIKKSIAGQQRFEIIFRGVTASPSCVMIQGFLSDSTLNDIRDCLRSSFKNSVLQQSIDKRYPLQTAHSTVVRFRTSFTKKDTFLQILENYRNYNFGTVTVDLLELVYNDWYQRKENVKVLYKFCL